MLCPGDHIRAGQGAGTWHSAEIQHSTQYPAQPQPGHGGCGTGGQGTGGELRAAAAPALLAAPGSAPPSPAQLWAGQDETQVVGTSCGKRGWRGQGPCLRLGQHCPPLPAPELLAAGRRPWRHVRPSVRRDQHWTLEPCSALDSPGEEGPAAPSLAGVGGWAAGGF